jgi:hypothetical protein
MMRKKKSMVTKKRLKVMKVTMTNMEKKVVIQIVLKEIFIYNIPISMLLTKTRNNEYFQSVRSIVNESIYAY